MHAGRHTLTLVRAMAHAVNHHSVRKQARGVPACNQAAGGTHQRSREMSAIHWLPVQALLVDIEADSGPPIWGSGMLAASSIARRTEQTAAQHARQPVKRAHQVMAPKSSSMMTPPTQPRMAKKKGR